MYVMKLTPIMQFTDLFAALPSVEVKVKGLILQVGLNKDQAHPAKESPSSVLLELLVYGRGPFSEQRTHRIFKLLPHKGIASGTAGNCKAAITECCAVWEGDGFIVQSIFPEQPIRKNMLIVEGGRLGTYTTNEATVALDDI